METIILYFIIFIIGTLFGSFSTLAIYRLPLHQDITHKRSYCPNCNHRLSFWDMIPILSYVFLGGKCRYCKKKIKPSYIMIEIFTGIVFLLFAMSINLQALTQSKIAYLVFGLLYLAGLIIIAGIDNEKKQINKPVLVYEIVVLSLYMIYLYIVEKANIYRYVIYLMVILLLFIINTFILKKKNKDSYVIDIVILSIVQAIFSNSYLFMITAFITLLAYAFTILLRKIAKQKENIREIPFGYYLCFINILTILFINNLAQMLKLI